MSSEFLKDYFPIMLFLFIALGLSIGFIVLNFVFSPKNPDPENYLLTSVALSHLMIQEWNLMSVFT